MVVPTHGTTDSSVIPQFDRDIRDVHLIYDYDSKDAQGNPEKWKYEMYVKCDSVFKACKRLGG
jgi:hypothetical protein